MAGSGTFGYELDLEHMDAEEKRQLQNRLSNLRIQKNWCRQEIIIGYLHLGTEVILCSGSLYQRIRGMC